MSGNIGHTMYAILAGKADFRHALWQMGEAIVGLFQQVIDRQPRLQELPAQTGRTWAEISNRWQTDRTGKK